MAMSFDHRTHVRLMKESSELAKKYRIDCGLEEKVAVEETPVIKLEHTTVQPKVEVPEEVVEEESVFDDVEPEAVEEKPSYDRDALKTLLKDKEIKFFN